LGLDPAARAAAEKLLADEGEAQWHNEYGCYLEAGAGVSIDLSISTEYFKIAADSGSAQAAGVHRDDRPG
jgi:TPR repeat protein